MKGSASLVSSLKAVWIVAILVAPAVLTSPVQARFAKVDQPFLDREIPRVEAMGDSLAGIREAMNMLLYGKNYRRDREAVRILIRGLSSREEEVRIKSWENLKRLTGRDFALDEEVWRSWWQANEKRFSTTSRRPEA